MSRTIPATISPVLDALVSQPGYLLRIDLPNPEGTQYLCSFDTDFAYDDHTWRSSDFTLSGMSWTTTIGNTGRLLLGDADAVWWRVAAGGNVVDEQGQLHSEPPRLQDAAVSIWQAYAEAPNVAVKLWRGRIGRVTRSDMVLECDLRNETASLPAPRRRTQSVVSAMYLLPAGKVIMVGNQKWVLERKANS